MRMTKVSNRSDVGQRTRRRSASSSSSSSSTSSSDSDSSSSSSSSSSEAKKKRRRKDKKKKRDTPPPDSQPLIDATYVCPICGKRGHREEDCPKAKKTAEPKQGTQRPQPAPPPVPRRLSAASSLCPRWPRRVRRRGGASERFVSSQSHSCVVRRPAGPRGARLPISMARSRPPSLLLLLLKGWCQQHPTCCSFPMHAPTHAP
eukprot:TRINITY_DN11207_c1_g1_i5.p1 TRINITY_DN11207_c1_g1~~TRINITY_DN11207_c1_g1_i5.p1  ORF type:complete len:203 (+),score=8.36 TRINITY_DN11207_c1_g1_i5:218-826(+)